MKVKVKYLGDAVVFRTPNIILFYETTFESFAIRKSDSNKIKGFSIQN